MNKNGFILSTNMIYVGDIFYRYEDNEEEATIIRICKAKNTNKFIAETQNGEITITRNELIENYTRLKNDAFITFFTLKLDKGAKDVLVAMHRRKDLDENNNVPYAVCRQQFENSFKSILIRDNVYHLGVSMSKDTCPNDVNYGDLFLCNGVSEGITVSTYKGDTLETILHFIKQEKFDSILREIDDNANKIIVEGTCRSLRELLEYHDFMYDYLLGFNITRVPFKVEDNKLELEQIKYLEALTKHTFIDTMVVPYDSDIDLEKIERSHIVISDEEQKLYIVIYIKGEYTNEYYRKYFTDKRDMITQIKYMNKAKKDQKENKN